MLACFFPALSAALAAADAAAAAGIHQETFTCTTARFIPAAAAAMPAASLVAAAAAPIAAAGRQSIEFMGLSIKRCHLPSCFPFGQVFALEC